MRYVVIAVARRRRLLNSLTRGTRRRTPPADDKGLYTAYLSTSGVRGSTAIRTLAEIFGRDPARPVVAVSTWRILDRRPRSEIVCIVHLEGAAMAATMVARNSLGPGDAVKRCHALR